MRTVASLLLSAFIFSVQPAVASIITYDFTNVHGESTAHFSGAQFSGSIVYDSVLSALVHVDLASGATTGSSASGFLPFSYSWSGVIPVYDAGGVQQSGPVRNPDGVGAFTVDFGPVAMQFGPTEIFVAPGEEPLAKLLRSEPSWNIFTDDNWTYNLDFNAFRYSTLTVVPEPASSLSIVAGLMVMGLSLAKRRWWRDARQLQLG